MAFVPAKIAVLKKLLFQLSTFGYLKDLRLKQFPLRLLYIMLLFSYLNASFFPIKCSVLLKKITKMLG